MKITKDSAVEVHFAITDTEGQLLDDTRQHPSAPQFLFGRQQMLAGVEAALEGKEVGEKILKELKAEEAFGPRNEQLIQQTTKDQFGDQEVVEGARFQTQNEHGTFIVTITKVDGNDVTVDMNHPLAGKDLTFDIEVLSVREATADELSHGHIHGPGCNH